MCVKRQQSIFEVNNLFWSDYSDSQIKHMPWGRFYGSSMSSMSFNSNHKHFIHWWLISRNFQYIWSNEWTFCCMEGKDNEYSKNICLDIVLCGLFHCGQFRVLCLTKRYVIQKQPNSYWTLHLCGRILNWDEGDCTVENKSPGVNHLVTIGKWGIWNKLQ